MNILDNDWLLFSSMQPYREKRLTVCRAPVAFARDESDPGFGGWNCDAWRPVWRGRRGLRRNLFQYFDDRLSGDSHRPFVQRPDRRHDLSADRQLRREFA